MHTATHKTHHPKLSHRKHAHAISKTRMLAPIKKINKKSSKLRRQ
jgi:hypothetical protein